VQLRLVELLSITTLTVVDSHSTGAQKMQYGNIARHRELLIMQVLMIYFEVVRTLGFVLCTT